MNDILVSTNYSTTIFLPHIGITKIYVYEEKNTLDGKKLLILVDEVVHL